MTTNFPNVFSPTAIGPMTLRNRLVALPAGTGMASGGVPSHDDREHFGRLAAGGVGLIITGASVVHQTSTLRSRRLVEAYNEEAVSALADKAAVVHRQGAKIIGQLVHLGREFIGGESDAPPSAPSPIKTVRDAYPPRELPTDEIRDIVEGFRISADHLARAGYDGVELHAAHGYLPAQFLSPLVNHRDDRYGGTFANRMRFVDEVVAAMRGEMKNGMVLGVRLSAEEDIRGGMGIEDCIQISQHLAESGSVDYLSITHGTRGTYVKDATHPDGVAVDSAARVREATGLPVLVGQRIRDAATADHLIKTGKADLVGMARSLIADPELPNKSKEGRLREIRGCIGVIQDCRAFDPHLHCAVNAEIGRPRHPSAGVRTSTPKEVFVVGGGPAGLEAARVAAERGHKVTVFEATAELGGAVRTAARSPHRATILDVIDYLENEMRRLKVDVNFGAAIREDDLADFVQAADHVIVATGSRPGVVPGTTEGTQVVTVDDVLCGAVPTGGGRAVVFDESDGFWPSYSAAEVLAAAGWNTQLVTPLTALASRVPGESVGPLLTRLGAAGVRFHPASGLELPTGGSTFTTIAPVFGGDKVEVAADLVVWHRPRTAVDGLARALGGRSDVDVIGDCLTPRRIGHAIAEGYRVGVNV